MGEQLRWYESYEGNCVLLQEYTYVLFQGKKIHIYFYIYVYMHTPNLIPDETKRYCFNS